MSSPSRKSWQRRWAFSPARSAVAHPLLQLLMGDELQDFVRTYLAEIDEAGSTFALPPVVPAAAGEVVWQKALRWYPRALVNLVNSRACRGECSPLRRPVGT
jgi:hypothetical protein